MWSPCTPTERGGVNVRTAGRADVVRNQRTRGERYGFAFARRRTSQALLALAVVLMHGFFAGAYAGVSDLIMPGEVIEGHAKYERECTQCHAPFHKERQGRLCLKCHEDVAADVESGEGFHSHVVSPRRPACASCHVDHEGRTADITGLDPATFDHTWTDFQLAGAHRQVACAACHAPGKRPRQAPSECAACHADDDPHHGTFEASCAACHDAATWSSGRFEHGKTGFDLTGAHGNVNCLDCHANATYRGVGTTCAGCHAFDDAHGGTFGSDCTVCHESTKWRSIVFDHDRNTKYPLHGRHRETRCGSCHQTNPYQKKPGTTCASCHAAEDVHHGRNGLDCARCHNAGGWKRVHFDHARDGHFPLRGRHESLACESCHVGKRSDPIPKDCSGCHTADDVHAGTLGARCDECHDESGWGNVIAYDHDLARFPLLGMHAAVACEECHLSPVFLDAPTECQQCHERDDAHEGRLGRDCAACHNPNGWRIWRFDHDRQTTFPLTGAHRNLDCLACHTTTPSLHRLSVETCIDCHREDDSHEGRFGDRCERCHATTSFAEVRMP